MILAKGKIAKKPYELSYLGQNIYSIEERTGIKRVSREIRGNDCGRAWAERFGCYDTLRL